MHANIIKTCATHDAMRSGGGRVGYMLRNTLFYILCYNFFPQETQIDKSPISFPEKKILYNIDCWFDLSYFFLVNPFFLEFYWTNSKYFDLNKLGAQPKKIKIWI